VTESQLIDNLAIPLDILNRLCLKGITLSIDDFGTGYSSMEQLKSIPFSELKIDRTFVNGANQDETSMAILKSSIDLAKNLNMTVVAEGVEIQDEWDLVSRVGCDIVQGYFVAKPMPVDKFDRWLKSYTLH